MKGRVRIESFNHPHPNPPPSMRRENKAILNKLQENYQIRNIHYDF
jgi:hypothetical protein